MLASTSPCAAARNAVRPPMQKPIAATLPLLKACVRSHCTATRASSAARWLHDELLYTHSSGLTDTKAQHRTRHRPRGDRGGDQRPAAQPEARVPQRLDKNAEGLEIHRVAVDAAAHHIAMGHVGA